MRVTIDAEVCQGHGRCYAIAPELFEPDDVGQGLVIGDGSLTADDVAQARLAVDNCPERAITLDEDAG